MEKVRQRLSQLPAETSSQEICQFDQTQDQENCLAGSAQIAKSKANQMAIVLSH